MIGYGKILKELRKNKGKSQLKLAEEIQVLREDVKFEYNTFNNVDDLLKSLKDESE